MGYNATIEGVWNGEDVKVRGRKVVGKTALEIGYIVASQAKLLAPVETGLLASSIHVRGRGVGSDPEKPGKYGSGKNFYTARPIRDPESDNEVLVGTSVSYGPYVEFGVRNRNGQPFLRPSLDLARGRVLTIVKDEARFYFREYMRDAI